MLRPTKHMDLSNCVLQVASVIIAELRGLPAISLSELDGMVRTRIGETARFNFLPALNFLFLIGCLDYEEREDSVFLTASFKEGAI